MNDNNNPGRVHYIHRLTYTTRERLVGAFVLSALLIGAILFIFSGQAMDAFAPKFTLIARIPDASGLARDSKVFISGVQVGHVRDVSVTENNDIRLELEILERFHPMVRVDSRASLSKLAMIGNASIEIRAGDARQMMLADGSVIPMDAPMSVDQLMAEAAPVLKDFKHLVQQLDRIVQAIDPDDINGAIKDLRGTLANAKNITAAAAGGQDVNAVLANARTASGDVRAATRDLPELMLRIRVLIEQLNVTVRAVQGTWPVSSSVPAEVVPPMLAPPEPQP